MYQWTIYEVYVNFSKANCLSNSFFLDLNTYFKSEYIFLSRAVNETYLKFLISKTKDINYTTILKIVQLKE